MRRLRAMSLLSSFLMILLMPILTLLQARAEVVVPTVSSTSSPTPKSSSSRASAAGTGANSATTTATATVAETATTNPKHKDIHLAVIPYKSTGVNPKPSCVHTQSHLQFINTHQTDTIVITSVETLPDENDTLQFHMSKFQERTVTIKPLASVLLPITFIPVIPSHVKRQIDMKNRCGSGGENGHGSGSGSGRNISGNDNAKGSGTCSNNKNGKTKVKNKNKSLLSRAAAADLKDLIGSAPISEVLGIGMDMNGDTDSNIDLDLHFVKTFVEVQSTRGVLHTYFNATAHKYNPFQLPHTITFYSDGYVSSSNGGGYGVSEDILTEEEERLEWLDYLSQQRQRDKKLGKDVSSDNDKDKDEDQQYYYSGYEFDLYMGNPYNSIDIPLLDIFLSRPDLVGITFSHDGKTRFNSCGHIRCSAPTAHDLTGPPVIPPETQRAYVGTLVVEPQVLNSTVLQDDDSEIISLGYLQIATPNTTLSVSLEYINREIDIDEEGEEDQLPKDDSDSESAKTGADASGSATLPQTVKDSTDTVDVNSRLKISQLGTSKGKKKLKCDPLAGAPEVYAPLAPSLVTHAKSDFHYRIGKFSSSTSYLDFGLLTVPGEETTLGISVTNHGNSPSRLMRYKVSVDSKSSKDRNQNNIILLSADGKVNKLIALVANMKEGQKKSAIVEPGETVNDLVYVSMSSSIIKNKNYTLPLEYRGSVILHFGPSDVEFAKWRNSVINDPLGSQDNVLEISFKVRIMHGHITYNVNEIYFPQTKLSLPYSDDPILTSAECRKSFDRAIYFENMFPETVRLTGIEITNDQKQLLHSGTPSTYRCEDYFQILDFEGSNYNTKYSARSSAKTGETWGGIFLRYKYVHKEQRSTDFTCTLVLKTDIGGIFHVPLNVFSGMPKIDTEATIIPDECQTANKQPLNNALDCLELMEESSPFGSVLSQTMNTLNERRRAQMSTYRIEDEVLDWRSYLGRYFLSVSGLGRIEGRNTIFTKPIFLSLGSISSNTIETYSLHISNPNPVPMRIHAMISAVEGMEIRLAQTSANVVDYVDVAESDINGDTQSRSNEWLKKYLSKSTDFQNIIGSFSYRDDISLSRGASNNIKYLYQKYAKIYIHQNKNRDGNQDHFEAEKEKRKKTGKLSPEYSHENCVDPTVDGATGPFLVVKDKICGLEVKGKYTKLKVPWSIPPGGVAKFEVLVRSPVKSGIYSNDIVDILSTGIVLRTDYNHLIPVIATYRSLSGQLKIAPDNVIDSNHTVKTSSVLQPSTKQEINLSSHNLAKDNENGFTIENSFSTDLVLKKVYSCNKWFHVHLHHNESMHDKNSTTTNFVPKGGSVHATVHSSIDCPTSAPYPSFFDCALDWLEGQDLIQTDDCGDLGDADNNLHEEMKGTAEINELKSKAAEAFKGVVSYMKLKYSRGGGKKGAQYSNSPNYLSIKNGAPVEKMSTIDEGLSQEVSTMFLQAFQKWRSIVKKNLNVVTGNARAHFDLLLDDESQTSENSTKISRTISTTLDKSYFRTSLEIPVLFDAGKNSSVKGSRNNLLDFGVVTLSHSSEIFVPVKNPSGYPMRVRLTVPEPRENEYGTYGKSPVFVQSKARMKHSWWTGGSYFLPDGKGSLLISNHNVTIETTSGSSLSLMNPSLHSSSAFMHGCSGRRCGTSFPVNNDQSQLKDIQHTTPIGASSAVGSVLSGRLYSNSGSVEKIQNHASPVYQFPPFALGLKGTKEITIPPFSSAKLGPLHFRPPSRNEFRSTIYLENSLTGLEKVQIKGTGGLERVIFIENNDVSIDGGIETRFNKPTLMFTRSSNDFQRSMVRNVLVANVGDTVVKFDGFRLGEAKIVQHISVGQMSSDKNDNPCERRGFKLLDCQDRNGDVENDINPSALDTFTLNPKEAKHLRVMHTIDCNFRSMYVSLLLNFASDANLGSHEKSTELLLGYDLNSDEFNFCSHGIQTTDDRANNQRKKGILRVTSLILPLLILSLVLVDILHTASRRWTSSRIFQTSATVQPIKNSNKTGFRNWTVAFRCLSRADPDSSDLINLGKEQTRQILLTRYRKEGLLQPQCILPNGAFSRERQTFAGNSENNAKSNGATSESPRASVAHSSRRNTGTMTKTLSETIFFHTRSSSEYNPTLLQIDVTMPIGLDWKRAAKRGVMQSNSRLVPSSSQRISKRRESSLREGELVPKSPKAVQKSGGSDNRAEKLPSGNRVNFVKVELQDMKLDSRMKTDLTKEQTSATAKQSEKYESSTNNTRSNTRSNGTTNTAQPSNATIKTQHKTVSKLKEKSVKVVSEERSGLPSLVTKNKSPLREKECKNVTLLPKKTNESTSSIPKTPQKKVIVANVSEKHSTVDKKTTNSLKNNTKENVPSEKLRKPQDSNTSERRKISKNKNEKKQPKTKTRAQKPKEGKESTLESASEHTSVPKSDNKESKTPQPHTLHVETSFVAVTPQNVAPLSKESLPSQTPKYSPIGPRQNKPISKTSSNNAPSTAQEDDSFSVSGESLSSASQFSHVESVSQIVREKQPQKNLLRPPPGLAPPPGFASTDKLQIPGPDKIIPTNQFNAPPEETELSLPQNSLLSSLLGNQQGFTDTEGNLSVMSDHVEKSQAVIEDDKPLSGLNHQADVDDDLPLYGLSHQADVDDDLPLYGFHHHADLDDDKPLLGVGQDFNVMNFLSFLDEGVHAEESSNIPTEEENNSTFLYGSSNTPVQANPWGGTRESRALAYGIEVEAGNNKEGINGNNGMQLLTPSIILGQNSSSNDREKDEVVEDGIFDFANLLEG